MESLKTVKVWVLSIFSVSYTALHVLAQKKDLVFRSKRWHRRWMRNASASRRCSIPITSEKATHCPVSRPIIEPIVLRCICLNTTPGFAIHCGPDKARWVVSSARRSGEVVSDAQCQQLSGPISGRTGWSSQSSWNVKRN